MKATHHALNVGGRLYGIRRIDRPFYVSPDGFVHDPALKGVHRFWYVLQHLVETMPGVFLRVDLDGYPSVQTADRPRIDGIVGRMMHRARTTFLDDVALLSGPIQGRTHDFLILDDPCVTITRTE